MILNFLRFLLLILVFDSTLCKTPIPPNKNSLKDDPSYDIREKLEKHELKSEKPMHLNGKSMEENPKGKKTKKPPEIEFISLRDPTDNFSNLQSNSDSSHSKRNEKADRELMKKVLKYMNESFEETEDDLFENTYTSMSTEPMEKASGKYLSSKDLSVEPSSDSDDGPVSDDRILMKHHANRNRKLPLKENLELAAVHHDSKKISRIDRLVINQQKVVKTVKSRGGGKKNSESGRKSGDHSMLSADPETIMSNEATSSRKNVPSKHADITEITTVKEDDSKRKDEHKISVDNKGNVSDSKGDSLKKSDVISKEQSNSSLMHHKSGKDVVNAGAPLFRNSSIKDLKSVSHVRKNKLDKPPLKHISEVKLSRSERIPESDRGYYHKKSKMFNQDPWNLRHDHFLGNEEAYKNYFNDENFPIVNSLDSRDVSRPRKSKHKDEDPSIKHLSVQNEVKLSRIPEEDTGTAHKKSKMSNKDPLNLKLHYDANINPHREEPFPFVDAKGPEHVSHAKKNKPSLHKEVHLPNHKQIKEHDKVNSPTHFKDVGHFPFAESEGPEDVSHAKHKPIKSSFHKEVQHPNKIPEHPNKSINPPLLRDGHSPYVDSKGSEDVSHSKKKEPIKPTFHRVHLPNTEQITEEATSLEPTQESLSESLKVLFYNQSLYQEVIHLVKTDRNVQAYVFNVLLLYVPVLICDVLLWLVIFKLLRHIHRQFVSNRLNSAMPSAREKRDTKQDSAPGEPDSLNLNKEAIGDCKKSKKNPRSEGTWYPPK